MSNAFVWFSVFSFFCISTNSAFGQGELTFLFNNSLKAEQQSKWLGAVEGKGTYDNVIMPKADFIAKNIYEFARNTGIAFTDEHFLDDEYAIEMYLYLSSSNQLTKIVDFSNRTTPNGIFVHHGKILINQTKSDLLVFKDEDYAHFLLVRKKNEELVIYANGQKVMSITDSEKNFILNKERVAQFFVDDCLGTAQGAMGGIALFKIFPYQLDEQDAKDIFAYLPRTLKGEIDNITVRGVLRDASNKQFLGDAEVIVTSKEIKAQTQTANNGSFGLIGTPGNVYNVKIHKAGYVDYNEDIVVTRENKYLNVSLLPLKPGQPIILESVHFEKNESKVLPISYEELNKLAQMMIENPKMDVLIEGHTDNLGSEGLSIKLSEDRANAVKAYLVSKGVHASRIQGKGIGGARPIADNSTEENRKLNRRVEFTILKY